MPFPAGRRMAGALAAVVIALLASATLALPARADSAGQAVTGPADGAVVGGTAVTFTATGAGIAYEFRWGTDPTVDAGGRLSDLAGGGRGTVRAAEYTLSGLDAGTYYWQVRALEDAATWSAPRSFTIDPDAEGLQLETYPLDGAPSASGMLAGVDGRIWVAFATLFAVALLAVVFARAARIRRAG